RLDKLTPQHVANLLDLKRQPVKDEEGKKDPQPGLSPQSLVNIRTVLRSALAQALKWGLSRGMSRHWSTRRGFHARRFILSMPTKRASCSMPPRARASRQSLPSRSR